MTEKNLHRGLAWLCILLTAMSAPSEGRGHGKSYGSHETMNESKRAYSSNPLLPDIILGNASASVDLIVYSAFTCSHCAEFHLDTLSKIQKEYVETGKVRLVLRDFPLDKASLAASTIARAQDQETYLKLAHAYYKDYEGITNHENPLEHIKKLSLDLGLKKDEIERALSNKALEDKILNGVVHGLTHYKIEATPTVIVGDKIINHAPDYKELKGVIEEKLKGQKKPS